MVEKKKHLIVPKKTEKNIIQVHDYLKVLTSSI